MELIADIQEVGGRYAPYIEELHAFFATHHLPFGAPRDLATLGHELAAPGPFREELASITRSFILREGGRIPRAELFALLAIAAGGPHIEDAAQQNPQDHHPVSLLMEFVTEVSQSHKNTSPPAAPHTARSDEPHLNSSADPAHTPAFIEPEPEPHLPEQPDHQTQDQTQDQTHPATSGSDFNDALRRLELNNLEMKLYLGSIDERMSRMEPRLESYSAPATTTATLPREHIAPSNEGVYSRLQHDDHTDPGQAPGPAPFSHHSSAANALPPVSPANSLADSLADSFADSLADSPATIPTARIVPPSSPSRRRNTPLIGAVALLVIAAIIAVALTLRSRSASDPVSLQTRPQPTTPVQATPSSPRNARSAPSAATIGQAQLPAPKSPETRSGAPATPTDPSTPATQSIPPATTATDAELAEPADNPSFGGNTPHPTRSYSPDAPRTSTSARGSQHSIKVSSGVMAGNLIFSSPPEYPRFAGLTHTEGPVLLQAVISRTGTVENLHVIRGHHLLRGAAMDAVRKWRYRPYIVNGHAVEVATIVKVDFHLHQ